MLPLHSGQDYRTKFGFTSDIREKLRGWMRLILADSHSRSLFLFLLLNLSFAFVELLWGMMTNSLSLITDSFHMFFDCTGLLAGLVASLITKWRPNEAFSYGYVRAETLAGFVNGLFLIFIAFFIFSEAVERTFEPPEVHHDRLFIVSVGGFIVNLLGIYVFHDVAHGHSHGGGGGHGHSHSGGHEKHAFANGDLSPLLSVHSDSPFTVDPKSAAHFGRHDHSHDGGHGHSHDGGGSHGHSHDGDHHGHSHGAHDAHSHHNQDPIKSSDKQIMKGVYLHVLADTLGSVGVIISAIIMKYTGWMVADPICSMIISCLIAASVLPLIKESACILLMRCPRALDGVLPSCYQKLMMIEGVYSVQEPHFWTLCSDVYVGTIKLEVSPHANAKYVITSAHSVFAQIGVRQLYVQLDFAAV